MPAPLHLPKRPKKVGFLNHILEEKSDELTLEKQKPEFDHLLNKINTRSPYKFLKKPGENFFKIELAKLQKSLTFNRQLLNPQI